MLKFCGFGNGVNSRGFLISRACKGFAEVKATFFCACEKKMTFPKKSVVYRTLPPWCVTHLTEELMQTEVWSVE